MDGAVLPKMAIDIDGWGRWGGGYGNGAFTETHNAFCKNQWMMYLFENSTPQHRQGQ